MKSVCFINLCSEIWKRVGVCLKRKKWTCRAWNSRTFTVFDPSKKKMKTKNAFFVAQEERDLILFIGICPWVVLLLIIHVGSHPDHSICTSMTPPREISQKTGCDQIVLIEHHKFANFYGIGTFLNLIFILAYFIVNIFAIIIDDNFSIHCRPSLQIPHLGFFKFRNTVFSIFWGMRIIYFHFCRDQVDRVGQCCCQTTLIILFSLWRW